jgi:hypothetical protein
VRDGGGGLCVGWYGGAYEVMVGGCALAKREARVRGWAKTRNRAAMARLRARRVKWRRGMVRRGGTVVSTSDGGGGGGGCVLAKHEVGGGGVGPKTRNRAPMARLRTGTGLQEVEGGTVGLQAPLPC